MKIGINAIFLVAGEGGGIERYLRNLIKGFQRIDHENEYTVFTNRDNTGTFDLCDSFKEHLCPVSARLRPMKILWEQFILPLQVKKVGIDLLFSPGNISPFFVPCASVVVIHDLVAFKWPENFSKAELYPLRALLCLTAKKATKIITVSKSSQAQILDLFNIASDKTAVVYPACDENFLRYRASVEGKERIKEEFGINGDFILCTASTRAYKNLDRLLLAFRLLKKKYGIRHRLVITGLAGRHHQALVKMTAELRLTEEVLFTGYVSDRELPALYSAASVFVYPSFYEGFGLPVLEAMACGTPVVASNVTSLPEVIGDAGLLFDPHNVHDMAGALHAIVAQRALRAKYITKGFERTKLFSWDKTASELLSAFVLASRGTD